ncbi:ephrin type-A receptor 2 [Paramuricea clavata]|uniref:Ephrin type-A receptor 2 n=1 Tax=Paramuricea clavata TaxID=317549 RepID=A0A6S7KIK6_PARCT|nr:ephrin type-A receptor 2 [Paramuricea clavata]
MKMYYYYCEETFIKGIKFERTLSPTKGFKNVTGNCSEYAIPQNGAKASFNIHCYSNGTWSKPAGDHLNCFCIEGFAPDKTNGSCSSCSNTSFKKKISNDNCTECPANTVSNVNRNSCVCKDGYYKRSSDSSQSESSPCYALPEIREKPRARLFAYGVELSWTAPKNSLNEIILYNVTCFICSQRICIPCQDEAYHPSSNNLRQTSVIVSNLIAGGNYVFRVYVSVKDVVPEGEWRYIETDRVQVTSDSVKETTDCTDNSGIIINIIIATTVAGVFLSIIIVLFVKYKRLKRDLRLLTHVDIPLKAVDTPQESLPIDQV